MRMYLMRYKIYIYVCSIYFKYLVLTYFDKVLETEVCQKKSYLQDNQTAENHWISCHTIFFLLVFVLVSLRIWIHILPCKISASIKCWLIHTTCVTVGKILSLVINFLITSSPHHCNVTKELQLQQFLDGIFEGKNLPKITNIFFSIFWVTNGLLCLCFIPKFHSN